MINNTNNIKKLFAVVLGLAIIAPAPSVFAGITSNPGGIGGAGDAAHNAGHSPTAHSVNHTSGVAPIGPLRGAPAESLSVPGAPHSETAADAASEARSLEAPVEVALGVPMPADVPDVSLDDVPSETPIQGAGSTPLLSAEELAKQVEGWRARRQSPSAAGDETDQVAASAMFEGQAHWSRLAADSTEGQQHLWTPTLKVWTPLKPWTSLKVLTPTQPSAPATPSGDAKETWSNSWAPPAGFSFKELHDLLGMNAQFAPKPPLDKPGNWKLVFLSPEIGPYENRWALWKSVDEHGDIYAVNVRGTIPKLGSLWEDAKTLMIAAHGVWGARGPLNGFYYKFAEHLEAAVHHGFAEGALYLLHSPGSPNKGILAHLKKLPAGTRVLLAGHSQGAAIATLLRAALRFEPALDLRYRSYFIAQPKPGNDDFAHEFLLKIWQAFNVVNPDDIITQVPLTKQGIRDLDLLFDHYTRFIHNAMDLPARVVSLGVYCVLPSLWGVPAVRTLNFVRAGQVIPLPFTWPEPKNVPLMEILLEHHLDQYKAKAIELARSLQ